MGSRRAAGARTAEDSLYNARDLTSSRTPGGRMSKLTLKEANTIIEKALEKAREMKIKPVSVVVLDDAGNVRSAQREDGASMFRFDVALGKAWASVAMGVSSRALLKRAKDNPNFFITLAATAKGKFLPQTGGVLIKNEKGEILGAAGASGGTGEEDEAACVHGIEQAGLVPDASG
jgi:uncharacterized protein GlcG (DUF336 family)